jgi:hypothetical protein
VKPTAAAYVCIRGIEEAVTVEGVPFPGDVLRIDGRASVQFQGDRAMTFQVIRVDRRPTYDGWLWLEGYVLNNRRRAVQRRRIFVRQSGLFLSASA